MHELSICESIARAVTGHAGGRRVRSVKLQVGALRQVVPDTLAFCWPLAARGPVLEGSALDVELVPGEIACAACGARHRLTRFVLSCPACGGPVTVVAGEELLVLSIEVDDETPSAAGISAAGTSADGISAAGISDETPGTITTGK